ncbi:hypothetical protein GF324_04360 [bacterium]|nr:hypothetical protein [bacterium]
MTRTAGLSVKAKSVLLVLACSALTMIGFIGRPAQAQNRAGDVPEVVLEAYSTGFYRPALIVRNKGIFELPQERRPIARRFSARLYYALKWSGYVEIVEDLPEDSTTLRGTPPMELVTSFGNTQPRMTAMVWLGEPGETEAFYEGDIGIEEGNADDAAEAAAEELLYRLTGMLPPFRSRIVCSQALENDVKELVLLSFDGAKRWPLTKDGSINLSPGWSPDGRKIVFCSFRGGRDADLYIADLDARRIRPLLQRQGTDAAPAWSPDGKQILFAGSSGAGTDLYLVNPDGANLRNLTRSPSIDTSPSWAPTSRDIVFMSDRSGNPQIYRIDVDGANLLRLTYDGTYNAEPAWSPAGDRIVYVRREANGFQLRMMTPAGDADIPLTNEPGDHLAPAWTPDGMKISYTYNGTLWVMNADGTDPRELAARGNLADWSPISNPD